MTSTHKNIHINEPINQTSLYGYEKYFSGFKKLIDENRLPKCIIFSGQKGSGKATFCYHLINYILSTNEDKKYSLDKYSINSNNKSYNLTINNTHPNLFLIDNNLNDKQIKIEQIHNLITFTSKTTYKNNIKVVLIDNVEYLNKNSSNALLKVLEEPNENTFFFLVHNSSSKILNTIKSRCIEYKIFFNNNEKKKIIEQLFGQYINKELPVSKLVNTYYFDSPGSILKYFLDLDTNDLDIFDSKYSSITYFIEKYMNDKSLETLSFISLFIEHFYNEMCMKNLSNMYIYFFNKNKILEKLNNMKKFNLDEKNVFIEIKDILAKDAK
tara:strand:+ start:184 stop:1161 length:978 start_codon:yes stop_codon:yes gene_type:complete